MASNEVNAPVINLGGIDLEATHRQFHPYEVFSIRADLLLIEGFPEATIYLRPQEEMAQNHGGGGGDDDEGDSSDAELPCLSLGDLSPLNPPPKEHLLVVLKGYFDGGNQVDSRRYDRITLATALGTSEQWCDLESAWKGVLDSHGADFLHTTNAVCLQKEFSKNKGWTDDRVNDLISDCVNVIEQHIVVPGRIVIPDRFGFLLPNIARSGLNIFTFTIPLADYRRARKINPKLPNSVTEVCTTESLGICFKWGRRIGAEWYELYFDQGEPFYGHVHDRWHNRKSKKQITLMNRVVHVRESDMRVVRALQIADLFAWCINHVNDVRRKWHERLNRLPWDSLILDYGRLLKPIPGKLERTAAWNLPTRKLDR
jgi:hypothetical protein